MSGLFLIQDIQDLRRSPYFFRTKDPGEVEHALAGAEAWSERFIAQARELAVRLDLATRMLTDPDFEVVSDVRRLLEAALIYAVDESDAIADSTPLFGHMDDAIVLGRSFDYASAELDRYRNWLAQELSPPSP